ncbi:MAG TPA: phosphate/phosphite/phosphonate ABC transporter substrate-binding protein [Bacillus bacterium]|nr:phosphate/phosphite/phosphonate ABC transporter substrate-binding protein [Bacillus sp. (in: firmicutes)]
MKSNKKIVENTIKKIVTIIMLTAGLTAFLSACSTSSSVSSTEGKKNSFVIVYVPQENEKQAQKLHKDFEEKIANELGAKVEVHQVTSFNAAIEAMRNKKVDMALFGPFSYIVAEERADAEAIALLSSPDASTESPSVIVVQKDSKIRTVEDLNGKTMGFSEPVSTTGHLLPKYTILKQLRISVEQLEQDGQFFKNIHFAGGHDKALLGVVRGQYDAAGVSAHAPVIMVEKGIIEKDSYRVIAEAEPIHTGGVFAVRKDLDQEIKDRVQAFLLTYNNPDYFKALVGAADAIFIEANDDDFYKIREIADILNLTPEQLLKE